jgi:GNAT superfamily N-acetyltransferase
MKIPREPESRIQTMTETFEIVSVNRDNVDKLGFFCYKSKAKFPGYKQKRRWLEERFDEGLQMRLAIEDGRSVGFIEYIPGPFAWRAVNAEAYMAIHCIWVVGRAKEKGYGSRLLDSCLKDAREQGFPGVAMVTSRGVWLAGSDLFLRHGFALVDSAPPSFDLAVLKFNDVANPSFPTDWDDRIRAFGEGVTVVRTSQCPYLDDATNTVLEAAQELGLPAQVVEFGTADELRRLSPTPFGIFSILARQKLVSYSYLLKKDLIPLLQSS